MLQSSKHFDLVMNSQSTRRWNFIPGWYVTDEQRAFHTWFMSGEISYRTLPSLSSFKNCICKCDFYTHFQGFSKENGLWADFH